MKILLYNPDNGVTRNFMPHLWMFLLQAITPPGHEVILIDGNARAMTDDEIVQFVREQGIGMVGIGAMTRMVAKAYRVADAVRAAGVLVVMGGPHVTEVPDEALGRDGGPRHADAIALGEADETWPLIVEDAAAGRGGGREAALRRRLLADVDLATGRSDPLVGHADQPLDVVLTGGVVGLEDVGAAPVRVEDDDVAATRVDEVVEEAGRQDAIAHVQRLLHRLAWHAVRLHEPQLHGVRDRHGHRDCQYEVDDRVLADRRERALRALGRARRHYIVAHRTSE